MAEGLHPDTYPVAAGCCITTPEVESGITTKVEVEFTTADTLLTVAAIIRRTTTSIVQDMWMDRDIKLDDLPIATAALEVDGKS